MNAKILFMILLIFQAQPLDSFSLKSVFRLISYVTELVPLIFDYKEIVQDIINPADNVDTQILAVLENLQKVQHQIKDMLSDVLVSVDFNPYLNEIASAQRAISSVNEDFENFQKASNENEKNRTRTIFIELYKYNTLETHLRNLRDRAKGTPILSLDAMPPLLSKKLKCNMTAVRHFQRGYLSLMMNGYALKGIYTNMTGGDAESEVNDWIVYMNGSVGGLLTANQICMDNYPEYAIKDLEAIDSVETLHKTVQEKYTWLESLVVSYSKRGFQYNAIYTSYLRINNVIKQMTESKTKVLVFCEKKGNGSAYHETKVKILEDISKYQRARTGDGDKEAAKHILDSILETTKSLGSYPYAIIIFADHIYFPSNEIGTDYCANDVSFEITFETVYQDSDLLWQRATYKDVKYHIHIFLPSSQVIDQLTSGFNPNDFYTKETSASFKAKASTSLLILSVVFFFLYFSTWQYK